MSNLTLRYLKIVVLLASALFGTIVFVGNVTDYESNYQFVQHVLSMDTTFEGNQLMWRAITSETMHTAAYWTIILAEGVFAALAWIGTIRMWRHVKGTASSFNGAKAFGFWAYAMAVCIWFIGFIVVGSEWFAMWQSDTWNGKQTAMDIVEVMIGFAILLALKDGELKE